MQESTRFVISFRVLSVLVHCITTCTAGFVVSHHTHITARTRTQTPDVFLRLIRRNPRDGSVCRTEVGMMPNTLVWTRDNGNLPFDMDLSSAKMIVFDKDGTLGDDKASLKRWACHMTDRIEETIMGVHAAQRNRDPRMLQVLVTEFHNQIGWDPVQQQVLPSAPLAAGTWDEQVTTLQTLLNQYQLDDTKIVAAEWHSQVELHSGDNPVIPNLRGMLLDCQNRGLRITVCTSDERQSTDQALQNWKVQDIISDSICGDEVDNPKPSAEPLERLCRRGGVAPHECIVVGDTISDVGMARNSKALFCIGVLTGSGTAQQLTEMGASIVVPSVEHIPELLSACGLVPGIHT